MNIFKSLIVSIGIMLLFIGCQSTTTNVKVNEPKSLYGVSKVEQHTDTYTVYRYTVVYQEEDKVVHIKRIDWKNGSDTSYYIVFGVGDDKPGLKVLGYGWRELEPSIKDNYYYREYDELHTKFKSGTKHISGIQFGLERWQLTQFNLPNNNLYVNIEGFTTVFDMPQSIWKTGLDYILYED